jgi:phenylpyruvate tautomerase PptA (4-oxalocrotonate tautomerase family)
MPLVRIDLKRREDPGFGRKVGEVLYRTMTEVIGVPDHDNFQVITEHDDGPVYDPGYLGILRSDGILLIQITLSEGRTVETKQRFYRALTDRLSTELGVRPADVFVNLVEVRKENWSFGEGIAQYVEAESRKAKVESTAAA